MKARPDVILLWVTAFLSLSGLVTGVAGDSIRRSTIMCSGINACVQDSSMNRFASGRDITKLVDSLYGGYMNVPAYSIDLWKMEKLLMSVDYMRTASCFLTPDGMLNVLISQTTPVAGLRRDGKLIYLGGDGRCMRADRDWKKNMIRIGGSPSLENAAWRKNLGRCCSELPVETVDSLYCEKNGELAMFLKGRDERFLFGRPQDAGAKMRKAVMYVENIAPRGKRKDGEAYTEVDLRYRGQIVCK